MLSAFRRACQTEEAMPGRFGLTESEFAFLRRLSPPHRIQRYLDEIDYDVAGAGCRSPRRVLRERRAQCMDGALFGAAALRAQGYRPLILDLEAVQDSDHVLAVFRERGCWGAVARSNFAGLRYREPVYRTLRELAISYFENYFNLRGERTLRRYSRPVDLGRFDGRGWMAAEEDLWYIPEYLCTIPHTAVLAPGAARRLSRVRGVMFEAGLVGRTLKG
jgi:hypothetical protein